MDKILIEIYIPCLSSKMDIYIPTNIKIHEILKMIKKSIRDISEFSAVNFIPTQQTVLCDRQSGAILDINMDADELCLHNGTQLLLI